MRRFQIGRVLATTGLVITTMAFGYHGALQAATSDEAKGRDGRDIKVRNKTSQDISVTVQYRYYEGGIYHTVQHSRFTLRAGKEETIRNIGGAQHFPYGIWIDTDTDDPITLASGRTHVFTIGRSQCEVEIDPIIEEIGAGAGLPSGGSVTIPCEDDLEEQDEVPDDEEGDPPCEAPPDDPDACPER